MQLIQSKIIPASQNAYWEPLPEAWQSLSAKPVLVFTVPYEAGSSEERTLFRMLDACKLPAVDYHILQLAEGIVISWGKLKETFQPAQVLLLGILPAQLGIHAMLRLHAPNHFGGCIIIPSFSPAQLDREAEAKKLLWQDALKPVFVDTSVRDL